MIPIDEQIVHQQNTVKIIEDFDDKESLPKEQAILASLERLKAIDAVQVPEEPQEPNIRAFDNGPFSVHMVEFYDYKKLRAYAGTLRDLLKRESARADGFEKQLLDYGGMWDLSEYKQRAEAAEAKLATETARADAENREVLRLTVERNTAESTIAAMLKLGENPSESVVAVGKERMRIGYPASNIFTAMFAKLVEQAGVKK